MKKISAIRNIPYLTIILLTLICILLLSSKNMIMSQASYPEATIVSSAYAVVEGSDSDKEEITFPHTFKHLSPRTHVTVTTHINLNKDDPIYIKTVYSPAKVYLDDDLIYEFGRAENYPSYPLPENYPSTHSNLDNGLDNYFNARNVNNSANAITSFSFSRVKTQINRSRPIIIGTTNHPTFGDHWIIGHASVTSICPILFSLQSFYLFFYYQFSSGNSLSNCTF